jgi:hypothetical protein
MCRKIQKRNLFEILSVEQAADKGYTVHLISDGVGEVRKPDGTRYHILNFWCDCADAQHNQGGSYVVEGRRWCKHTALLFRATVCDNCYRNMVWPDADCATEADINYFNCRHCGNAKHIRLVRLDREKMLRIPFDPVSRREEGR